MSTTGDLDTPLQSHGRPPRRGTSASLGRGSTQGASAPNLVSLGSFSITAAALLGHEQLTLPLAGTVSVGRSATKRAPHAGPIPSFTPPPWTTLATPLPGADHLTHRHPLVPGLASSPTQAPARGFPAVAGFRGSGAGGGGAGSQRAAGTSPPAPSMTSSSSSWSPSPTGAAASTLAWPSPFPRTPLEAVEDTFLLDRSLAWVYVCLAAARRWRLASPEFVSTDGLLAASGVLLLHLAPLQERSPLLVDSDAVVASRALHERDGSAWAESAIAWEAAEARRERRHRRRERRHRRTRREGEDVGGRDDSLLDEAEVVVLEETGVDGEARALDASLVRLDDRSSGHGEADRDDAEFVDDERDGTSNDESDGRTDADTDADTDSNTNSDTDTETDADSDTDRLSDDEEDIEDHGMDALERASEARGLDSSRVSAGHGVGTGWATPDRPGRALAPWSAPRSAAADPTATAMTVARAPAAAEQAAVAGADVHADGDRLYLGWISEPPLGADRIARIEMHPALRPAFREVNRQLHKHAKREDIVATMLARLEPLLPGDRLDATRRLGPTLAKSIRALAEALGGGQGVGSERTVLVDLWTLAASPLRDEGFDRSPFLRPLFAALFSALLPLVRELAPALHLLVRIAQEVSLLLLHEYAASRAAP